MRLARPIPLGIGVVGTIVLVAVLSVAAPFGTAVYRASRFSSLRMLVLAFGLLIFVAWFVVGLASNMGWWPPNATAPGVFVYGFAFGCAVIAVRRMLYL
jgi:hypothetical protein